MSLPSIKFGHIFKYAKNPNKPKRMDKGLYHGAVILTGNQRSFSERKTKRKWKPNAHWVKLYSEAFDTRIQLKATARALRCIDKAGGLDKYLLNTDPKKVDSRFGQWLKNKIKIQMKENEALLTQGNDIEKTAQAVAQFLLENPEELEKMREQDALLQDGEYLENKFKALSLEEQEHFIELQRTEIELLKERVEKHEFYERLEKKKPKHVKLEDKLLKKHVYVYDIHLNEETRKALYERRAKNIAEFERLQKLGKDTDETTTPTD
ncbi:hypothetical protein ABK040_015056 [Willaertia magna]